MHARSASSRVDRFVARATFRRCLASDYQRHADRAAHISNFGVIEQLVVTFGSGFIVFTGETGAENLLIDAVTLLVGGRASADQIRAQADEADLEAAFQLPLGIPSSAASRERICASR